MAVPVVPLVVAVAAKSSGDIVVAITDEDKHGIGTILPDMMNCRTSIVYLDDGDDDVADAKVGIACRKVACCVGASATVTSII